MSESKEIDGIRVPVATPAALYRLKRDTVRPIDHQDAAALRRIQSQRRVRVTVQKFRSVEEMGHARVLTSTEDAVARFLRHCARYRMISPRARSRGVVKFRTLHEAQSARTSSNR